MDNELPSFHLGLKAKYFAKRKRPSRKLQQKLLEQQDHKCFWCGIQLNEWYTNRAEPYFTKPAWDHLLPFSYSLNNQPENYVASCKDCNRVKADHVFDSIEECRKYIRRERWLDSPNSPPSMPMVQEPVRAETQVAEVLHPDVPDKVLLGASQDCPTPVKIIHDPLYNICTVCGTKFQPPNMRRRKLAKYCSYECLSSALETKRSIERQTNEYSTTSPA